MKQPLQTMIDQLAALELQIGTLDRAIHAHHRKRATFMLHLGLWYDATIAGRKPVDVTEKQRFETMSTCAPVTSVLSGRGRRSRMMPFTEAPAIAIQRPLGAFEKLFWRRAEPTEAFRYRRQG